MHSVFQELGNINKEAKSDYLDVIDSSEVVNGDEAIAGLVELGEGLANHPLPRVRHRGLGDQGKF